ncbi:hypothetical protein [Vogesella sp. XCS3]|uniref:hypothetical protein n=1 Tax=Vogesella sp. XCS3 TaxID=2877939 RepID=UPI001D0AA0BD|nr:hypothetical protein [Vogesella sp. XCS3]UDM17377.1 hypothetical protein LCH97_01515 [Vogesella sp. XCS3]
MYPKGVVLSHGFALFLLIMSSRCFAEKLNGGQVSSPIEIKPVVVDISTSVTDYVQLGTLVVTLLLFLGASFLSWRAQKDVIKSQEELNRQNYNAARMQLAQKDRELRSVVCNNRLQWMQTLRESYVDYAAMLHEFSLGNKNSSISEILKKQIDFLMLLNPTDRIHQKILDLELQALEFMKNSDSRYKDCLDDMEILIQFVIRLEWRLAKLELSQRFPENHVEAERQKLIDKWRAEIKRFDYACRKYGLD